MRVLALDIGGKRVGVAVSDPQARVATPISVLPAEDVLSNSRTFKNLISDWEPDLLLCGLPLTLQGEEGPQAQRVREIAQQISETTGIPLEFTDERLSSRDAKAALRELGYDEKTMRGKVDMVAANLFLQAWLDAQNS